MPEAVHRPSSLCYFTAIGGQRAARRAARSYACMRASGRTLADGLGRRAAHGVDRAPGSAPACVPWQVSAGGRRVLPGMVQVGGRRVKRGAECSSAGAVALARRQPACTPCTAQHQGVLHAKSRAQWGARRAPRTRSRVRAGWGAPVISMTRCTRSSSAVQTTSSALAAAHSTFTNR